MKIYNIIKNSIYSLVNKKTMGARALVIDNDKVMLVKHTYISGWYTIGGAVEEGESPKEAITRELFEEVGVLANSLELFNVYYSNNEKRDDYIVFYICTDFSEKDKQCDIEIKEKKWFQKDKLPDDISPATLQRIKEYFKEVAKSDKW